MLEMEFNQDDPSFQEDKTTIFASLFALAPTPHAVFSKRGHCLLANQAFQDF